MSVNVSPRQFVTPDMARKVGELLAVVGLPPSQLILEITESAVMQNPELSISILEGLRAQGIGSAITLRAVVRYAEHLAVLLRRGPTATNANDCGGPAGA